MRNENKIIIFGLSLMAIAIIFGIAYGADSGDKLLCDRIMYSDNWTLGYLRNVSSICSNGEEFPSTP